MKKETLEILNKVYGAVSELDKSGEDEGVSNALAIVWAAIQNVKNGAAFDSAALVEQGAKAREDEFIG